MIGKGVNKSVVIQIDPIDDCAHRKSKRTHRMTIRSNMWIYYGYVQKIALLNSND